MTNPSEPRERKRGIVWVVGGAAVALALVLAAGAVTINVTVIVVTAVSESQKKQADRRTRQLAVLGKPAAGPAQIPQRPAESDGLARLWKNLWITG